ncbi:hypothetical protein IFM89_008271 [Coptis chinensis]|uniref:Uncharacterized protein n=1 Tax=Coptis chinensis TaxID=261450 RepID=A0A835I8X8_9MAGN|nr:hypothetical protein IFM89_008271 [Coptis chinensis]
MRSSGVLVFSTQRLTKHNQDKIKLYKQPPYLVSNVFEILELVPKDEEYFPSFLSVSEYLLACKEQKAREFGIHMYISLFDEFTDTYSRHEILDALVTHIGSGVIYEVGSALEAMVLLASKYSQELITLSSYINGILDYIEEFNDENIHKVYEVFSHLALSARSNADSVGSSIANELLTSDFYAPSVFVLHFFRQVSNQELKYKKMGLIGTLKIVSCLGHIDNATHLSSSQAGMVDVALDMYYVYSSMEFGAGNPGIPHSHTFMTL